ncbi:Predicted secreted protein [Escherichia coli]|uniref:phage tail tube protein n=1 Tax=Escherichia coli TaxID=562 RepID=UPI0006A14366|nr:phage tail tube protein [Escherichia coli]CTU77586.1 Predicted secreted protein [Escherichia coli]CTV96408.1 Predicted secreted protein [Escherichia coli]CTX36069.1 Predicted secreted protein [Escherichia coli]CTX69151.1 Predicted secreted protein [Escherichia coli]CTY55338.1 Predicted secreted protein [Escherichia coli]
MSQTCDKGSFLGRDVAAFYAIACPNAKPEESAYKALGMMRGKSLSVEWETADATADKSADYTKESMVTYKSVSFSGDGVSRTEEIHNQKALKRHVINPGETTGAQPYVWLKLVSPLDVTEGPFLCTSFKEEDPHDDVSTWSIECESAGKVTVGDVPSL